MIREDFQTELADGRSDCVLVRPEGEGPYPGVIHLTDVGGIRPAQIGMAERLAGEDYAVFMPNLFYRTARPPVFELGPNPDRDTMMKRVAELVLPLTPERAEGDAVRYVDEFLNRAGVRQGPIGVVGYCFSGALALRFAAARPDVVTAAASFHGGDLFTEWPSSPHHLLPRILARLYFGHAVKDPYMPAEAIAGLEGALAAWGGQYESEVYEGAYHSWTTPDSPVHNAAQAERAFGKLVELLGTAVR